MKRKTDKKYNIEKNESKIKILILSKKQCKTRWIKIWENGRRKEFIYSALSWKRIIIKSGKADGF